MYSSENMLTALFNTLRLRQNGRHFTDNIFKLSFCMKIIVFCLKFHRNWFQDSINTMPALVQMMALHQIDNKPLFEPKGYGGCLVYRCIYVSLSLNVLSLVLSILYEELILMVCSGNRNIISEQMLENKFMNTCFNCSEVNTFDDKTTWVQVMAWCSSGNKPLPEPILADKNVTIRHHKATMS